MSDQDAINEREWARPENWTRFGAYRSARDTRFWVPKKNRRLGFTVNFAQRGAKLACFAPAIVPLGFILLYLLNRFSR
jgi:hypothetical protein